ncbi:MAG: leucine-rich repeat protein [Odoribacteraceae bacterium]|jgi:hypothetical protein|nr:leucine-rich repeat protein [Odoribacteraceae bacterium]
MTQTKKYLLLALSILATACVKDVDPANAPDTRAPDNLLVTFITGVPGQQAPGATRAMDALAENTVSRVDLLAFKVADGGKTETFDYHSVATGISDNKGDGSAKKFIVKLQKSEEDYRFVLLANLPASISQRLPHLDGGSKESILAGIIQEQAAGWQAGIPMWAETGVMQVNNDLETAGISNIAFTRALAKFDVIIATDEARQAFSLQEVYLYNRASRGRIAPLPGHWNTLDKQASMPEDNDPAGNPLLLRGPLLYTVPAGSEHAFEREIYTFETSAARDPLDATCIVIGGVYASAAAPSYYRLDVKDDQGACRDILRNHLYAFRITKVNGPGYETPDQAFRSAPLNMVATIAPWNESDLNDITFTGQYHLSIDKSRLDFYAEGAPKSIEIMTDFPDGWTVKNLPAWLEVESISPPAAANARSLLTIRVNPALPPADREDAFLIVAGNIEKPVLVSQTPDPEFTLEVNPLELIFYRTPARAQEISVTPRPAADGVAYKLSFDSKGIAWADGYGLSGITPQTTTLQLKPAPNAGTTTLNGTLFVTLDGPNGQTITRVITIKQLAREIFLAAPENPYPAAGGKFTFEATSEITWKLSTDPSWITLEPSETDPSYHPPALSPYRYQFELGDNTNAFLPRAATINVASDNARYPAPPPFEIVQSGTPPALEITPKEINLAAGAQPVTLSTNAPWYFTVDDAYHSVVGSASVLPNETRNAERTTPAPAAPETILFAPRTLPPDSPYMGKVTTVVTFFTGVPGATNNASHTLTLAFEDKRTYSFSKDHSTLTLFSTFYAGVSDLTTAVGNIPELGKDGTINPNEVKTFVLEGNSGDLTSNLLSKVRYTRSNVLKSVVNVLLPQYNGVIPANAFSALAWLESIDVPLATGVEAEAFNTCTALSRVSFPFATTIGDGAFRGCALLYEADLPNAWQFGARAFSGVGSGFRLKIDSPAGTVAFAGDTFGGATSAMTLQLGAGVRPARPSTLPAEGSAARWKELQWNKIEAYK